MAHNDEAGGSGGKQFWELSQDMSSSSSDDESLPTECDWCHDDRGQCDRPHLDEDRHFSIKLEETFDVQTVRNDDKCFFRNQK